MGGYADSEEWADIVPIAQDDGGPNPLAAIAYTDEYIEAMSYLRAVMANNERSDRALELTTDIIAMNPAHYTVWLYRASILSSLDKDPIAELSWLEKISLKHLKNYQIWQHRQVIMSSLSSLPRTELPFLTRMLTKDAKNYHVWSYRLWLVRHFSLWDSELPYIETLLRNDVRNNSVWNHRWFVVFGREELPFKQQSLPEKEIVDREAEFAKKAIMEAPQNQSAWNYLRGVLRKAEKPITELKDFAGEFADLDKEDEIKSTHALDLLADIYIEEKKKDKAERVLKLLANRYDPIRKSYWIYKRDSLHLDGVKA